MTHRFNDVLVREDKDTNPVLAQFTVEEAKAIAEAVAENPKANLAANLSIFSRYAMDTRINHGLSLFQTAMPLMPNWGQISKDDSQELASMKEQFSEVVANNIAKHHDAQREYRLVFDPKTEQAFEQRLLEKYMPEAYSIAKPIAESRLIEEISDIQNRSFHGGPVSDTVRTEVFHRLASEELITAMRQLGQNDREGREREKEQVSQRAFGELHGKSWHEVLSDCFERDVLPAFAEHCEFSNPETYQQVIDRVREITVGRSESFSMR